MVSCEFVAIVKHERILSEWAECFWSSNALLWLLLVFYYTYYKGEVKIQQPIPKNTVNMYVYEIFKKVHVFAAAAVVDIRSRSTELRGWNLLSPPLALFKGKGCGSVMFKFLFHFGSNLLLSLHMLSSLAF